MAKIMYGGGVSKMSGKLGANVHARNLGGNYIRNYVPTPNPDTPAQQTARFVLSSAAGLWSTLTTEQRRSWNAWASSHPIVDRLGQSLRLSGFNAFVKVYCTRSAAGDASPFTWPPSAPVFSQFVIDDSSSISCVTATDTLDVTFGRGILPLQILQVYACGFIPVTKNFTRELMTLLSNFSTGGASGPGFVANLGSEWVSHYGSMAGHSGLRVRLWVRQYDQGQCTPWQHLTGVSV